MDEREQLEQAIANIEKQRALLGDAVVDSAISAMRAKLSSLAPAPPPAEPEQQRKQVTVLFGDVSGFTAMSETMDHEDVSMVINSLWSRVDKVIIEQGGRIDKHIGDAVMALFGVPSAREDDPERAVRAALRIHSSIESWKQEFSAANPALRARVMALKLRIGINTGQALVGKVSTTSEYTAMGDAVNLASRVESAAPIGGTLISHNTFRHVRGIFDMTALEPITVKGKSEPVQVYRVNGIRPHSFRMTTRGIEGIQTRTIGREVELTTLESLFDGVQSSKGVHLINIVAEAGTGKSRLLQEFARRLEARSASAEVFRGRATADMEKVPYSALRAMLAAAFEIQDSDRAAAAREKLEQGIQVSSSRGSDPAAAHFIGQLIGFDYSTSPYLKGILGDARQIRDRAFHYLAEYFAGLAEHETVIIYLDDIHWADSASLDWVDYMLSTHAGLRLLFVCLMRPTLFERRPDWRNDSEQRTCLDLALLSEEQCRQLVAEILQRVPEVPTPLVDLIAQKAEGSPFYIEELVKVLIEGGVIVPGDPQWAVQMSKLQSVKVPDTLAAVLQARLDTLIAGDREILQQASVVGRIFWPTVLAHMRNPEAEAPDADPALQKSLHALRLKELIFENGQSTFVDASEYIFRHAVLYDVTYESVLLKLRRVYHRQVAEGLIWLSEERAGEYAGRIGEHYELAGDAEQAGAWYIRAGKQAQDTYAPEAAINYYQKALAFLRESAPDAARQLEVCQRLAEVLTWQARYAEAIDIYKSMLETAAANHDAMAESQALLGIAFCLSSQGDYRAALDHATNAENLARQIDAKSHVAKALWAQGTTHHRLGEAQAALSLGEQALQINTQLDDRSEMARCMNLVGAAYYSLGDYPQAEQYMKNALALFEGLGNRALSMDLLNNLGVVADARGDYNTAFLRYHSALEIARETGYRDGEIVFLSNRGGMHVALGNFAAAEADLKQAIERAGKAGSWILPGTYYELSQAALKMGKHDGALQAARTALALSQQDGSPEYIGAAYRALGMVAKELGRSVASREDNAPDREECDGDGYFEHSLHVLDQESMERERARTLREWARYELKAGHSDRGTKMWKQAREIFDQLGAEMEVERMAQMPS